MPATNLLRLGRRAMADRRPKHRDDAEQLAGDGGNVAKLREVQPDQGRETPSGTPQPPGEGADRTADRDVSSPRPRPRRLRRILLLIGPVLMVAAGLYFYLSGGRYVSTDNAYIRA